MIVIIGAGPAGLAAARSARSAHLVVEQDKETGGLCRSFELAGCIFDLGGHAFFSRDRDLLERFEKETPCGVYTQPRKAFVRSHGVWLPYPFQANLFGLPDEVIAECLEGLDVAARNHKPAPETIDTWIEWAFGRGIARHFLRPYNEKVWAWPLDQLRANWADDRIVKPDRDDIVRGARNPRNYDAFPNALVRYPARGGFANFFAHMRPPAERLVRGRVVEIDGRAKTLSFEDGQTLSWSAIVSTAPLDEICEMTQGLSADARTAGELLAHNCLQLVSFAVADPDRTDMQRVYSAEASAPFHKLVINSNSSDGLRANALTAIQCEVSYSRHKSAQPAPADACWAEIQRMGIIGPNARIIASDVRTIEKAYPVATTASVDARRRAIAALNDIGIFCAGRFGSWTYVNSDQAYLQGVEAMTSAERHVLEVGGV